MQNLTTKQKLIFFNKVGFIFKNLKDINNKQMEDKKMENKISRKEIIKIVDENEKKIKQIEEEEKDLTSLYQAVYKIKKYDSFAEVFGAILVREKHGWPEKKYKELLLKDKIVMFRIACNDSLTGCISKYINQDFKKYFEKISFIREDFLSNSPYVFGDPFNNMKQRIKFLEEIKEATICFLKESIALGHERIKERLETKKDLEEENFKIYYKKENQKFKSLF